MNIVFFSGNIIEEVEFGFIVKSKHISVCKFKVMLENNTVIKVKAYDEKADYCYRKLKKNDFIYLNGRLNNGYEVELDNISYIRH